MTEPKTHTLDAPGAVLHYDVRSNDASTEPVLLLIGSPMGAAGFVTLAGHFTDRTVVTYDPRGAGRSKRTDGASRSTTEEHADDLHRLIGALDAGPAPLARVWQLAHERLDGRPPSESLVLAELAVRSLLGRGLIVLQRGDAEAAEAALDDVESWTREGGQVVAIARSG